MNILENKNKQLQATLSNLEDDNCILRRLIRLKKFDVLVDLGKGITHVRLLETYYDNRQQHYYSKKLEFKNKQLQATLINLEVDNVKLRNIILLQEKIFMKTYKGKNYQKVCHYIRDILTKRNKHD